LNHPRLIVLTGGPGAGKTAVLEFLRKSLCEHNLILPEAASILFNGGFWRLESTQARQHLQKCIYHVQSEMEEMAIEEKKWAVLLCDRGTLDGAAYWPSGVKDFCKALNTDIETEYKKYYAVIQLNTPVENEGYNFSNPVRVESAAEAIEIDARIHEIWKGHPRYTRIPSNHNFMVKAATAAELIKSYLADCCKS
jgi:thymidylate kinase